MSRRPELTLIHSVQPEAERRMGELLRLDRAEPRPEYLVESRLLASDPSVTPGGKDTWKERMALLHTALTLLDADSSLVLSLANHDDEGRLSATRLLVGVACHAVSPVDAQLKARRGLEEVLPFLSRQLGYRFGKVYATPAAAALSCLTTVEPAGVLVGAGSDQAGGVDVSAVPSVLLPRPSRFHPLRSAWSLLARCPQQATLEVKLQNVLLGDAELVRLERAVHRLSQGAGNLSEYPGRRLFTPGEADVLYQEVQAWLDAWLRVPRGVRLTAMLRSATPLPDALVLAVGACLFPGRHILAPDTLRPRQRAFDLRDCFNESVYLPNLLPDAEELTEAGLPRYPMPRVHLPQQGTLLGSAGGQAVRLDARARLRHVFVLGATGSGKSTLLLNMLRQDMATGQGVCLIDPNGDLYEDALRHVPPGRAGDVLRLDAADFDRAFGLNFLEVSGKHPEVMASQNANAMLRIMDRLYDLTRTGGPMFEMYMRGALLLAMRSSLPGLTLVEVARVFGDDRFRAHLLRHCTDAETVRFWREVAERAGGESALTNMAPYVLSKLNQMTHNDLIKPIIGQSRSTVDFRAAMDEGRIVLVNLSKGRLGELDARFLGMMLLSKLSAAALGRADVGREARRPFHVYVDEYHNYAGEENLSLLLAEGRKYGIALTLATQHLRQLDRGLGAAEALAAVLGNAATHIYFRTGPVDAEALTPFLAPGIGQRDLPYLPDFTAVVRILAEGRPLPPFVMQTARAPRPEWHAGAARLASQRMRQDYLRYTRSVQEVQEEIRQRRQTTPPTPRDGARPTV